MTERKPNPFEMCQMVRQRAHQLCAGAVPHVKVDSFDRMVTTAMREVEEGHVKARPRR